MAVPVNTKLDFGNRRGIFGLAPAQAADEPVVLSQLLAVAENTSWKDSVRVASVANVNIASPGATGDGVTLSAGDRYLLKNQTAQPENGIYIWNGAAVPMTRALDASDFGELEGAVVNVEEGTNAGTQWRQTQVNGVIGTNNVVWTANGTAAPAASETTAGILELATQAEADTGTDDARALTPAKARNASWMMRKSTPTNIGDGSATSITYTHNLGTDDVRVYVREVGGLKRNVLCEVQHTNTTQVTLLFDVAPALNSLRVYAEA